MRLHSVMVVGFLHHIGLE